MCAVLSPLLPLQAMKYVSAVKGAGVVCDYKMDSSSCMRCGILVDSIASLS